MQRRHLLAFAPLSLLAAPVRAQSAPEILARFPNGTFLENLVVEPEGRVLFTNYLARRIERWSEGAGAAMLAEVPAYPVSLTALGDGRQALAAHGASFLQGPAATRGTGSVLLLDGEGRVQGRIALPEAIFPNGGVLLAPGRMLLADSALGRIWAVDLAAGTVAPWLDHPLLTPVEGQRNPGVNGLKRQGEHLLVSNSARRLLLRVPLAGGMPETLAQMTGGVDDFAVAADGTIFAATHATGIARLAPRAATPDTIPAPGVEGSTAVALTPDGRALYALGTGGLTSGGRGEAVLARLAIA
ncbi:SMP-30/gluconolactonase/LRE family protein [Roseococcus suduntuyensis]|uniref:Sugar lactone lactonase YvrE n=1 Tax=Roseococcus suduntuyensis TaxID=455361 RepID=A0A840A944_9PROT|nr:hypothetical protein [Roseococcus suduntuyensis]MBB3896705.1 sugar lactone lactonase YvrE [Roseococcus suduntuyensis]